MKRKPAPVPEDAPSPDAGRIPALLGMMDYPPCCWNDEKTLAADREREALLELARHVRALQESDCGAMAADSGKVGFAASLLGVAAVEWLAARAAQGDTAAADGLFDCWAAAQAALNTVQIQTDAAGLTVRHRRKLRKDAKEIPALLSSPRGGPRIDLKTADNQTVLFLWRTIEAYRMGWRIVSRGGNIAPPAGLHPIPAACVNLDDLGPDTWPAWGDVGKMILRTRGEGATSHLRAAWKRIGKFAHLLPATPDDMTR